MMRLRTIAILRGRGPAATLELARQCWDVGFDLVEIPVQGDAGWQSLQAVVDDAGGRPVGAGTVLSAAQVDKAVGMGAAVVISPNVSEAVIETAQRSAVMCVPGVMTPTDVATAQGFGCFRCKLFPSDILGPGMIGALHGPFPEVRLIAVGGIDAANALKFVEAGAAGVAFGSSVESLLSLDDPPGFIRRIHEVVGA